ncbi:MAG: FAD-dependent oxidoreductase [Atopobiaceae bacterium]|nr:FAD-dependent oxidoreductase [Atopobiaceae bacterium]
MSDFIEKELVIIGAGPAGLSAAIYAQRSMIDAVTIEREAVGGQVILTSDVDNYPGVPHTDGFSLVDAMQTQAKDLGAQIVMASVSSVERGEDDAFVVRTSQGDYHTKAVIIAGGATPRPAGFEGEKEYVGRGVSYCATCDGMFFRNKEVFVIGGGNSAAEEALFLAKLASKVTLVVRKDHLRAQAMVAKELEEHPKASIRFLTSITAVNGAGGIQEVTFRDNTTGEEHVEAFDAPVGVFVFVGRNPASELVQSYVDTDEVGYVIANERMETRTPGLFVAGDIRKKSLRQIVTAASDGAIAATSVAAYLGQPVEG